MLTKGIFLSFITVFLWALYDVCIRFIMHSWDIDPMVFVSFTNLFGALVLLVIAGPGRLSAETLKSPHTWTFSSLYLLRDILYVFILALISATEANFILRLTIVFSLLIAWASFGRKPSKHDLIGNLFVLGGVCYIALSLDESIRALAIFLLIVMSIVHTLVTVISERHPTSNKAESIKDRCRVTGYVLLATSFVFLSLLLGGALAGSSMVESTSNAQLLMLLPDLSSFIDPATILSATVIGLSLVAVSNYFYFYATKLAKSETFLMVTALLPVFTFGLEFLASLFGWLDLTSLSQSDLVAGLVITLAAVYMIVMRHRHQEASANK